MTEGRMAGDASVFWLAMVQQLMGRAAHDVKDSLNGVAVNLEVIRSRASKAGAPAASIAPFAEAAGQQLERLTSLLDALLAVARPEREPVDVGVALRRVATLCSASSSADDAKVEVDDLPADDATTGLSGEIVRLALAAPLLDAVHAGAAPGSPVRCSLVLAPGEVVVSMTTMDGRRVAMPAAVAGVVKDAGIRWTDGAQHNGAFSLAFPRT
jgi:signal transduction histidine kinase